MKSDISTQFDNIVANGSEQLQAKRVQLESAVQLVQETLNPALEHLRALAADLRTSPLGKKAQANPLTAIAVGSVAALVLSRLFRR